MGFGHQNYSHHSGASTATADMDVCETMKPTRQGSGFGAYGFLPSNDHDRPYATDRPMTNPGGYGGMPGGKGPSMFALPGVGLGPLLTLDPADEGPDLGQPTRVDTMVSDASNLGLSEGESGNARSEYDRSKTSSPSESEGSGHAPKIGTAANPWPSTILEIADRWWRKNKHMTGPYYYYAPSGREGGKDLVRYIGEIDFASRESIKSANISRGMRIQNTLPLQTHHNEALADMVCANAASNGVVIWDELANTFSSAFPEYRRSTWRLKDHCIRKLAQELKDHDVDIGAE